MQLGYPAVIFFRSQRHVSYWAGGHLLPQCSLPLRQGENLADFVFNRGRTGIVINIEMAFSHASRNLNSLYEGLLLRDAPYKMARAICCGGMFKSSIVEGSISLSQHLIK